VTRREYLNKADVAILCLPDDASRQAAEWLAEDNNSNTVLIDASTAFRTDPSFTYGLPELSEAQRAKLRASKRISNPGCYPTGFISLVAPLVTAGIVPTSAKLSVNAISGYSGGGKPLMKLYEDAEEKGGECEPGGAYGFNLKHKHLPEMAKYTGLSTEPLFQPSVGRFKQGMLVNVPLHYAQLSAGKTGADIARCLKEHYKGSEFVKVMEENSTDSFERGAFLRPDSLANTNMLELFVNYNDKQEMVVLTARLDNLGKGASGAAVQNLNLALGLSESAGL
jgi:N-acetyl-gamma-glutamyl-phosphate reductase